MDQVATKLTSKRSFVCPSAGDEELPGATYRRSGQTCTLCALLEVINCLSPFHSLMFALSGWPKPWRPPSAAGAPAATTLDVPAPTPRPSSGGGDSVSAGGGRRPGCRAPQTQRLPPPPSLRQLLRMAEALAPPPEQPSPGLHRAVSTPPCPKPAVVGLALSPPRGKHGPWRWKPHLPNLPLPPPMWLPYQRAGC